jgi:hypothetical protein
MTIELKGQSLNSGVCFFPVNRGREHAAVPGVCEVDGIIG